jgi:hypothetical protein
MSEEDSPLACALGFVALPLGYWLLLQAILMGYVVLTQLMNTLFYRKSWRIMVVLRSGSLTKSWGSDGMVYDLAPAKRIP